MRRLLLALIFIPVLQGQVNAQDNQEKHYDMQTYYMVLLKKGPASGGSPDSVQVIQSGHMAHIRKMAADKKLVLAGPFMDDWEVRGIFILDVPSEEEARRLTSEDPAVKAGRLIMEVHPWYGPVDLKKIVAD